MNWNRTIALAALATALFAPWARASVITESYDFTASAFFDTTGALVAPVSPVTGSVTVTFDPAVAVTDRTSGIALTSLNIPLESAVAFNYTPSTGTMEIGGVATGVNGIATAGDFELTFTGAISGAPVFSVLTYTDNPQTGVYVSLSGSVTDLPEPGSLGLAALALGGLAARRRDRAVGIVAKT